MLVCMFTSCILIVSVFPIHVFAAKTTSEIVAENKAKLAEQEEIIKMYAEFYARQEEEQEKKKAEIEKASSEETKSEDENVQSLSNTNGKRDVQMSVSTKMVLWFVGMWLVGKYVYTIFGMQISITNRCAMKLYAMIANDHEFWYAESCKRYLDKIKRKNRMIIVVASVLVFAFVPLIGAAGFFLGLFLAWLFGKKHTGINQNNLDDTIKIFMQFAKPGMEDEMRDGLVFLSNELKMKSIFKYT